MHIQNFILIKYTKTDLDLKVDSSLRKIYLNSQIDMFYKMIYQIKFYYPKSNIHVLTNETFVENSLIVHKHDFDSNHCCKFMLYSLLQEPAMYLDCDILLMRRFNKEELHNDHPIKFYNQSYVLDYSKVSKKLNEQMILYNAGIIWIKEPSVSISKELQQIESVYFNDKEFIVSNNKWPYNDEYATSYYVHSKGWSFEVSQTVGRSPSQINSDSQSIHYTGLTNKNLFLKDYSKKYLKLL